MLKEKGYEVDVYPKNNPPKEADIIKYLKKKPYDAVMSMAMDPITAKVIAAAPNAKIFANFAVGYNNIDLVAAKKREEDTSKNGTTGANQNTPNFFITNTPGSFSDCIAEHTLALMLALTTRLVEADKFMRKGKYKGWSPMNFIGSDLKNKTLGLIGVGHIGERVAYQAKCGFNMNVLYYDIKQNENLKKDGIAQFVDSIDEVIKQSDIVSLHVPLFESTHHLMNEARLQMMKPTAFLINTARGPVVDEQALVKALQKKQLAGAGLDVFEFEPKMAKGLAKLPNVVLTPHIASARESARHEMATMAAQNIISVLETGKALNPVKLV